MLRHFFLKKENHISFLSLWWGVCISLEGSIWELVLVFHHVGPRDRSALLAWWQAPFLPELSHSPENHVFIESLIAVLSGTIVPNSACLLNTLSAVGTCILSPLRKQSAPYPMWGLPVWIVKTDNTVTCTRHMEALVRRECLPLCFCSCQENRLQMALWSNEENES